MQTTRWDTKWVETVALAPAGMEEHTTVGTQRRVTTYIDRL